MPPVSAKMRQDNFLLFIFSEPCTLSFVEMENNNLLLKWDFDDRPNIFHGEYIEFLCKRNTYIAEFSVIGSELRVRCDRGQLKYPRCIHRER